MISDSQPFFEKTLSGHNNAIRYNEKTRENNYFFQIILNEGTINDFYVVPDGYVDLIVPLDCDDPSRVCGTPKALHPFGLDKERKYFGVRMSPLSAHGFLKTSLNEITNSYVFLGDVRKDNKVIANKLSKMDSFNDRVSFMDDCIRNSVNIKSNMMELVNWSVNKMQRSNFSSRINDLAESSGYTERYIRKVFKNYVGLSPKMFSDIARFQQALHAVINRKMNVQDITHKYGYYDQSHFTSDFKKFAKTTPTDILKYL